MHQKYTYHVCKICRLPKTLGPSSIPWVEQTSLITAFGVRLIKILNQMKIVKIMLTHHHKHKRQNKIQAMTARACTKFILASDLIKKNGGGHEHHSESNFILLLTNIT